MVAAAPTALVAERALRAGAALALAIALAFLVTCGDGTNSPQSTASPTVGSLISTVPPPAASATPTRAPFFDSARALEHVRVLSVDIGVRAAGSPGERQAAEYILGQLEAYGYQARLQPFTFETYADEGSTVEVVTPEGRTVAASALDGSPSGAAEGELIDAGRGRQAEFPAGTAGKVALVERGDTRLGEKVANAAAAGAVAVIVYNNVAGPFGGGLGGPGAIPAVAVSLEDGRALAAAAAGGGLRVRVSVRAQQEEARSQNVVAEPTGGDCRAVVGGHYDSVPMGPGANDNASGVSVVLEMARVLAAVGGRDEVCFVLFGAEEIGLLGSQHYVSALTEGQREAVRGMLDFDMLAVGEGWPFEGSPQLVALAEEAAEALSLPHSDSGLPAGASSDHAPFLSAGIPAVLFNCFCDEHYHTADDRFEYVQPDRLGEAGEMGFRVLRALLGS